LTARTRRSARDRRPNRKNESPGRERPKRKTDGGSVRAAAGFHLGESFGWKKYLYVEDLVTDEEFRRLGCGEKLVAWMVAHARRHGCEQVHLDTRVTRYAAHKFYLDRGFIIGGHHFLMILQ